MEGNCRCDKWYQYLLSGGKEWQWGSWEMKRRSEKWWRKGGFCIGISTEPQNNKLPSACFLLLISGLSNRQCLQNHKGVLKGSTFLLWKDSALQVAFLIIKNDILASFQEKEFKDILVFQLLQINSTWLFSAYACHLMQNLF